MKKWLVGLVVVPMFVTGCATSAPQTGETSGEDVVNRVGGTLTVVTSRTDADALYETIEADFKARYPEVTDIIWQSSADYDRYITTRMNTTDYGDVLFVPFSMSGEPSLYPTFFEPLGTVEALESDYIDVTEADYEGVAYGLPTAVDFLGIMYNEQLFEAAGIETLPTTVDELLEVAKLIKEETGAIPFHTNYGPAMGIWGGALSSFGGEQFKAETLDKGTAFAEGQPIREIMDMFYALASNGYIEPDPVTLDSGRAMQMLADGEIAMRIGGLQDVKVLEDLSDESTIGTMPIPTQIEGKTSLAFGAAEVIGMNVNSANKATARAFIEFFISEASGYATNLGGMSPSKEDLSDEAKSVFEKSQIVLTAPPVAPEVEAEYAMIANEVGVARLGDVLQQVVNMGLYPDQYPSYSSYIAQLEASWSQAASQYEK